MAKRYSVPNSTIIQDFQNKYKRVLQPCHLGIARQVADFYRRNNSKRKKQCTPGDLLKILEILNQHGQL